MAEAINDAGNAVGSIFSATAPNHATVWNGTTLTELGTLGGQTSVARSVNNSGRAAGDSYLSDNTTNHATVWNGTTPTDLGTLGGRNSTGNDINNGGTVAGYSYLTGDTKYHATVWNGATATDLGTLGGNLSEAYAINDTGIVAGWSETSPNFIHATTWNGTVATDLNTFLDASTVNAGWVLERAFDINAHGWIVGDAHNTITNANHAFLLTRSPNETYVMFLAGLGLMAAWYGVARGCLSRLIQPRIQRASALYPWYLRIAQSPASIPSAS